MDIVSRLAATRLFSGVPATLLAPLARATAVVSLHDKEHLWWRGQDAACAAIIVRGLIQIVNTTAGGESSIIAIFGPREVVGLAAVLEGTPYPANAIAATKNTVVMTIAGSVLAASAGREPDVAKAVSRALLDHTNVLRQKIEVLSAGSIQARIAVLLLGLAERYGDEIADRTVLPLELSRGTIASLVSARVETVIRQMTQWERDGVVARAEQGFLLDLKRLEQAVHIG